MKKWLLAVGVCATLSNVNALDVAPFKSHITNNHQIVLLNHGLASFEERLQMIENAKKSIDVEYFIYGLDKSGKIFTQALIKKAKEGVKIRMLLDYAMIKSTFSPIYAQELKKYGIEVKYFNPTATLNQFSGTYRNHRKALIVDGESFVTGGRNIADEYFDLREDFNFLDRDIKVTGEIVKSVQKTFDEIFASEHSKVVAAPKKPEITDQKYQGIEGHSDKSFENDLSAYNRKLEEVRDFLSTEDKSQLISFRVKGKELLEQEFHGECKKLSFNSELPIIGMKNRDQRVIKHDIAQRFKNAKESVLFDSPYFITDKTSEEALNQALDNNVKVTLLTNSLRSTDAIYVYDVFDTIVKKWIDKGLRPFIFRGNLPSEYEVVDESITKARFGVHAKAFVFDNKDVVIGTYNFDPRSSDLNTEMTVSCEDNQELAKLVTEDIQSRINGAIELDSSKKVDDARFYEIGFMKKLGYLFLKIPSNLFDHLL